MFTLVSLEKIELFFAKYNINFTDLPIQDQAITIVLCNIYMILFYLFLFYVIYKVIYRLLDWMNLRW